VDEGSVLCLPDRHGLGRVEEVFGPVDEPLYTLRYAGGGEMPPEVAAGAQVFSVERFSTYVLPESVQVPPPPPTPPPPPSHGDEFNCLLRCATWR